MATPLASADTSKFPTPTLQWNDILKVIGSVAGFVGLGGGLLWFFGRSFYTGLFSAFGLLSLQVSIAPEDYLEMGTTSLVFFVIDILFTVFLYFLAYLFKIFYFEKILGPIKHYIVRITLILLVFIIGVPGGILLTDTSKLGISNNYFYENIVNLISVFMIFAGLETSFLFASPAGIKNQNEISENQSIISSRTPIAIARILILIAMLGNFLTIQSGGSLVSGYMTGCVMTLRESTPVVIFSGNPILIEGQAHTEDLYTYTGYFILFSDNDNYYLFREIDPDSYKPKNLFVVSKDVAKTIQVSRVSVPSEEINKYNEMCIKKIQTS